MNYLINLLIEAKIVFKIITKVRIIIKTRFRVKTGSKAKNQIQI